MPASSTPTKSTTQTVRINGVRTRLTTRGGKVTAKPAAALEWVLQAAAVRALRGMPEYAADAAQVVPGKFTLAADMNAARRSPSEAAKCQATGMAAGDPDLRIYAHKGRLCLIEFKVGNAPLTASQRTRHPLLAALGHAVTILRPTSESEAAEMAVSTVRRWLAGECAKTEISA